MSAEERRHGDLVSGNVSEELTLTSFPGLGGGEGFELVTDGEFGGQWLSVKATVIRHPIWDEELGQFRSTTDEELLAEAREATRLRIESHLSG